MAECRYSYWKTLVSRRNRAYFSLFEAYLKNDEIVNCVINKPFDCYIDYLLSF